jgi:hypothetical protein
MREIRLKGRKSMKKLIVSTVMATFAAGSIAIAQEGGAPAAHGASGADWGGAVSAAAQEGGIGGHASAENSGGKAGGAPAAHDMSGSEFGGAVSGAAQEGGLSDHASGR